MRNKKDLIKVISVFTTGTFAVLTIATSVLFLIRNISNVGIPVILSAFTVVSLAVFIINNKNH